MRIEVHPDGDARFIRMAPGRRSPPNAVPEPGYSTAPGQHTALAAALLPAMRMRSLLEIDAPVSSRLLGAIPRIQEIVHASGAQQRRAGAARAGPGGGRGASRGTVGDGRGVASFFTAGVGSYCTALKHRHEIDTLILVYGFDVPLDTELRLRVASAVRRAADTVGKILVEVETDLREFSDRHWEKRSGVYNCGSCEKCIRKMACLRGVGAQEAFPSFPCLDLAAVARMPPRRARASWTQTLRGVERWGGDPDLADAIRTALRLPARTGS